MSDQHDDSSHSADHTTPTPHDADSFASHDALSEPTTSSDPLSGGSYDSGATEPASTVPPAASPEASSDAPGAFTNPTGQADLNATANPPAPSVPSVPSAPDSAADASAAMSAPTGQPVSSSTPATTSKIPPLAKRIGTVLLILIIGFVVKSFLSRGSADVLEVGQCVSQNVNEIDQIDCGDAKAKFKVLSISKDRAESSIQLVCGANPATTTSYFESKEGAKTGNIICLGPVK